MFITYEEALRRLNSPLNVARSIMPALDAPQSILIPLNQKDGANSSSVALNVESKSTQV